MRIKRSSHIITYYLSIILMGFLAPLSTAYADSVKTLKWSDLIPEKAMAESGKRAAPPIDHYGDPAEQQMSPLFSPVKKELDGQLVKLPGFMVPLGGDENKITEFLLVPYFGACMHMPPPPTNQIVYVSYPKGVKTDMMYNPVWIQGPIKVDEVESELAVSGYSMNAIDVSIYKN